ncbi:MAG: ATP synthase F1 subunit delta [Ignavibacteria bacterium]|nr:ATP synthase F1 subunit delta [Ignavibacteria bacterium]MBI3765392.1 ATP synthase F1 subunit delta [Ignavibacteriales bacterium]
MSETRAAYRYALAILGVAEETKKLDVVGKDFEFIEMLIRETKEFAVFLKSPIVSIDKKKRVLTEILKESVSNLTMGFVMMLASKDREGLLPEVIQQFYRLRDQHLGILNVTTRTAVKFTNVQEQDLTRQVELATKKKVRMKFVFDPSLKGGFTVQHDDTVWDASVRHQLELLRERFVEGIA